MEEVDRPGRLGEPVPQGSRAEGAAAAVAVLCTLLWFATRLSPGIAFSVWQGPLLSGDTPYYLPLLSAWLAQAASALGVGDAAWRLNALSAVLTSLSLGVLAALATRMARALVTPIEAAAAGVAAAGIAATAPAVTYAATAAGPAPLTLFLAISALALPALARGTRTSLDAILLAALLGGLAAANHPTFAWLLLFILIASVSRPGVARPVGGAVAAAVVFLAAACLPAALAAAQGETLGQFLSHALLAPYPTVGDGLPQWGYGPDLLTDLSPAALLLAVPGLLLLFRRETRATALLLGAVFAMLGPFLPFLTNQTAGPAVIRDEAAPRLLVLAAVAVFASMGIVMLARALPPSAHSRPRRLALFLAVTAVVVTLHAQRAPDRRHTLAAEVARQVLDGCPDGAWLVTGDDGLGSLAMAYQRAHGPDRGIRVLPAAFLLDPHMRRRIAAVNPTVTLPSEFPTGEDLDRWRVEQPQLLRALSTSPEGISPQNPHLLGLALWDLVRHNPARWPVCFVGISSPWLTARAQLSGVVFCYPRRTDPLPSQIKETVERVYAHDEYRADPAIGETLSRLLLPISDLIRDQGGAEEAQALTQHLTLIEPDEPAAPLSLARAAARLGNRDEAARYAEDYATAVRPDRRGRERLASTIESDLRSAALSRQFMEVIAIGMSGVNNDESRWLLTRQLWEEDEVFMLARGYQALVRHDPSNVDALVEAGAAYAQVGDIVEAFRVLHNAAELNPIMTLELLQMDPGRFALLKVLHSLQNPSSDAYPPAPGP